LIPIDRGYDRGGRELGKLSEVTASRPVYLYALDARTGARLWSYETGDVVPGSPTVANGVLFFGSYDTNVYAFEVSGMDTAASASRPDVKNLHPNFSLQPI
jgi:outer membrane protein assembly factor BamB